MGVPIIIVFYVLLFLYSAGHMAMNAVLLKPGGASIHVRAVLHVHRAPVYQFSAFQQACPFSPFCGTFQSVYCQHATFASAPSFWAFWAPFLSPNLQPPWLGAWAVPTTHSLPTTPLE